jgi:hypothetical protein
MEMKKIKNYEKYLELIIKVEPDGQVESMLVLCKRRVRISLSKKLISKKQFRLL